jgi:hypothetical protein
MKTIQILLLFVLFSATAAFAQERYVKPVDEAKKDASFFAFREKVIAAVKKKDSAFILSIVDPQIKNSFGGDDGLANFKKIWKLNTSGSKFWETFTPVIMNGGSFIKGTKNTQFFAPYTFSGFPDDIDAFDYSAIFGNNVNLRKAAGTNSEVTGSLSYNIVKVDWDNSVKAGEDYKWLKVTTLGGKTGFVNADYVRSSIDYRAGFDKIKGKWKMTAFIAGD